MVTSDIHLFPYDSLSKYTETLVQCPICHYYLRINPQIDSMKYRIFSKEIIQFLTFHQFNNSTHSLVIEYENFTFSKIINFSDSKDNHTTTDYFPLFHLVNLSEYITFRDRVLELESNNNQLISNFKNKLDALESSYKQTEIDNKILRRQVVDLNELKIDFENSLSDKLVELDNIKNSVSEHSSEISLTVDEKRELIKQINKLERDKYLLEQEKEFFQSKKTILDKEILSLKQELDQQKADTKSIIISQSDPKLLALLNNERQQKREAIKEKKLFEYKMKELEEKIDNFNEQSDSEKELINNSVKELQIQNEQTEHDLTMKYEKKISELTLALQDHEETILLLQKEKENRDKTNSTKNFSIPFDKTYREQIADLFLLLQKQFNAMQYDIFLSFYDTEHMKGQLRNAFESFFGCLIQKANDVGRKLLMDADFSLFQDIRELNSRLKFTDEQEHASQDLISLHFVFNDLLTYIFSIIKAIKSSFDENDYVIVPDDVQVSMLVPTQIHENKISFHIPLNDQSQFKTLGNSIRIFRPISELYKNSFILITKADEIALFNNTYKLIPFSVEIIENEVIIEIDNFFSTEDSFQLGSFFDNQFFIIQKIDFHSDLDLLKSFIIKNSKLISGY